MIKHPLENYEMLRLENPHSMILEYGRVYGLPLWLLLTMFRLMLCISAIVVAFKRGDNCWIKYLLVPAFISLNLYYAMEPNGLAHRHFWTIGLFLSGIIKGWVNINMRKD